MEIRVIRVVVIDSHEFEIIRMKPTWLFAAFIFHIVFLTEDIFLNVTLIIETLKLIVKFNSRTDPTKKTTWIQCLSDSRVHRCIVSATYRDANGVSRF